MNGGIIVAIGLVVMVIIGLTLWSNQRATAMIDTWAQQNGLRIVQREQRWFRKGPYFWRSSKYQQVWYVTVIDPHGMQHRVWVRCGGHFLGVWSDKIDVRWES